MKSKQGSAREEKGHEKKRDPKKKTVKTEGSHQEGQYDKQGDNPEMHPGYIKSSGRKNNK
jgi:hypothetical protein